MFSLEGVLVIGGLLLVVVGLAFFIIRMYFISLVNDRNSWRSIAIVATDNLERKVNAERFINSRPAFIPLKDVLPERSSPATAQQKETACIATMRARITAAAVELGLEPSDTNDKK